MTRNTSGPKQYYTNSCTCHFSSTSNKNPRIFPDLLNSWLPRSVGTL